MLFIGCRIRTVHLQFGALSTVVRLKNDGRRKENGLSWMRSLAAQNLQAPKRSKL